MLGKPWDFFLVFAKLSFERSVLEGIVDLAMISVRERLEGFGHFEFCKVWTSFVSLFWFSSFVFVLRVPPFWS